MESRAAVFTSQPQAVEVFERGSWLPASMLGWRHDRAGACSAWVRVEFAGVVEDAWVALTRLRLPESPARHLALARSPRSPRSDAGETQQLPLVREGGAPPVGRRVPPSGGRRRAPGTGEPPAAAAVPRPVDAPQPAVAGRHRAPAEQGRHRAADTGMSAVVPADAGIPVPDPARDGPAGRVRDCEAPPPRSELPPAGPVVRGPASGHLDLERFTRPMRLDEGVGSLRRSPRTSIGV